MNHKDSDESIFDRVIKRLSSREKTGKHMDKLLEDIGDLEDELDELLGKLIKK